MCSYIIILEGADSFSDIPAVLQLSSQNHTSIYSLDGLQAFLLGPNHQTPLGAITETSDGKDHVQEVGGVGLYSTYDAITIIRMETTQRKRDNSLFSPQKEEHTDSIQLQPSPRTSQTVLLISKLHHSTLFLV